ncbi:hypothetical protein [Streptomyces chartreusis]|uniref:hypothetical protein n=1 Tax=Streptomyces chartreusis TaxID=1969 RepID=UPI003869B5CB
MSSSALSSVEQSSTATTSPTTGPWASAERTAAVTCAASSWPMTTTPTRGTGAVCGA